MEIILTIYSNHVKHGSCCYIWGTDSGNCTTESLQYSWRLANVPFCADSVNYPICSPVYKKLPPNRDHPFGRWMNHSLTRKDAWVEASFLKHVQTQIGYEKNKTMYRSGKDINGHKGHVHRRFWKRPDCQQAFKNLFCYINFPRCDMSTEASLPVCRSSCENFFKSCKYSRDLWRCGKSKWFNGYEPESPTLVDGNVTYLREYFPGQPWRQNKYTTGGSEIPICTPAILGSGGNLQYSIVVVIIVFLLNSVILFIN